MTIKLDAGDVLDMSELEALELEEEISAVQKATIIRDNVGLYRPADKFIVKINGRWDVHCFYSDRLIETYLLKAYKIHPDKTRAVLRARKCQLFDGYVSEPFGAETVTIDDKHLVNTWRPSTLVPTPGPFPTIDYLLDYITDGDQAGREWLVNWLAAKVQQPGRLMGTALVLQGGPGSGKSTVGYILKEILGEHNAVVVGQSGIENAFNSDYVDKLLVIANEVFNRSNKNEVSSKLKMLIAEPELLVYRKYADAIKIKSRVGYIFTSNSFNPVDIEDGDRRYAVFANNKPVTAQHEARVRLLYTGANMNGEFSALGKDEVAHFAHYLQNVQVDDAAVKRAYESTTKESMKAANRTSVQDFVTVIATSGLSGVGLKPTDPAQSQLYQCYKLYAEAKGYRETCTQNTLTRELRMRLGAEVKHTNKRKAGGKGWESVTVYTNLPYGDVSTQDETDEAPAPAQAVSPVALFNNTKAEA